LRPRIFIAAYSLCLLSLLGHLSLWVDEISQLMGTRSGTLSHLNIAIETGVGGVPLGWLTQIASIRLFGYSVESARLPSALFSIGCCFLIGRIARQLDLQNGTLAICLFAAAPLQFRYALEARPYAQGIFFGLLSTVVYLRLFQRPRFLTACWYAATVTLSLYSQPLSYLIPLGHLISCTRRRQNSRALLLYTAVSLLLAAVLFIPWYLYAAPIWRSAIAGASQRFHLPWKTPLLILREISGAGYIGALVLLGFATVALVKNWSGNLASLATWCICSCLVGGLVIDAWFGYFLAVRQFIFLLPFLALLAAEGLGAVRANNPRYAATAACLTLALFLGYDYRWMTKPREDWRLAARALDQELGEHTCIAGNAGNGLALLAFFAPRLADHSCSETARTYKRFVVVEMPYARHLPQSSRLKCLKQETVGQISIAVYSF
jgi:hypothetical protein